MNGGNLQACFAVGRAVKMGQFFEWSLTISFFVYRCNTDQAFLERTQGVIPKRFMQQTSAKQVQALIDAGAIGPQFLNRWRAYKDARNLLVHRWESEVGWPAADAPSEAYKPLIEHASRVADEAQALCRLLITYALAHHQAALEGKGDFRAAMVEIFKAVG